MVERMEIKLLDCTLRDGGYVNDWKFGHSCVCYMLQRLINSGVDIVELGFINENCSQDMNRTMFPNTQGLMQVYGNVKKGETVFVTMIDYGTCGIEQIQMKKDTIIDGIRIIFKKPNMYKAIEFGKQLMEKGYFICLQLVSITSYDDRDILDFCNAVNTINPHAVGIVDTYGLMHKEQVEHYYEMLDFNLQKNIAIGYHSHNNFQLAYSNSIELLGQSTNRTIIIDGSAYGMGKSAGNAPIELLAMHLNDVYNKKYDVNQFLEMIDTCIIPIFNKHRWGYSLMFYLSSSNNCHPSYIEFLLSKKTLSVESINEIVAEISPDKKLNYDAEYVRELYEHFQSKQCEDNGTIKKLIDIFSKKDVLLLAPGKSISTERNMIQTYIQEHQVEVISVNFVPEDIHLQTVFIGNSKRYGTMIDNLTKLSNETALIATSNVASLKKDFDYVINMERLKDNKEDIADNSTAMVLNLMELVGVQSLVLAGFDGYGSSEGDLYCDESLSLSDDVTRLQRVNKQLKEKIYDLSKKMSITFLTESRYGLLSPD